MSYRILPKPPSTNASSAADPNLESSKSDNDSILNNKFPLPKQPTTATANRNSFSSSSISATAMFGVIRGVPKPPAHSKKVQQVLDKYVKPLQEQEERKRRDTLLLSSPQDNNNDSNSLDKNENGVSSNLNDNLMMMSGSLNNNRLDDISTKKLPSSTQNGDGALLATTSSLNLLRSTSADKAVVIFEECLPNFKKILPRIDTGNKNSSNRNNSFSHFGLGASSSHNNDNLSLTRSNNDRSQSLIILENSSMSSRSFRFVNNNNNNNYGNGNGRLMVRPSTILAGQQEARALTSRTLHSFTPASSVESHAVFDVPRTNLTKKYEHKALTQRHDGDNDDDLDLSQDKICQLGVVAVAVETPVSKAKHIENNNLHNDNIITTAEQTLRDMFKNIAECENNNTSANNSNFYLRRGNPNNTNNNNNNNVGNPAGASEIQTNNNNQEIIDWNTTKNMKEKKRGSPPSPRQFLTIQKHQQQNDETHPLSGFATNMKEIFATNRTLPLSIDNSDQQQQQQQLLPVGNRVFIRQQIQAKIEFLRNNNDVRETEFEQVVVKQAIHEKKLHTEEEKRKRTTSVENSLAAVILARKKKHEKRAKLLPVNDTEKPQDNKILDREEPRRGELGMALKMDRQLVTTISENITIINANNTKQPNTCNHNNTNISYCGVPQDLIDAKKAQFDSFRELSHIERTVLARTNRTEQRTQNVMDAECALRLPPDQVSAMRWSVLIQTILRIRQLATAVLVHRLGLERFISTPEKMQHMLDCLELYKGGEHAELRYRAIKLIEKKFVSWSVQRRILRKRDAIGLIKQTLKMRMYLHTITTNSRIYRDAVILCQNIARRWLTAKRFQLWAMRLQWAKAEKMVMAAAAKPMCINERDISFYETLVSLICREVRISFRRGYWIQVEKVSNIVAKQQQQQQQTNITTSSNPFGSAKILSGGNKPKSTNAQSNMATTQASAMINHHNELFFRSLEMPLTHRLTSPSSPFQNKNENNNKDFSNNNSNTASNIATTATTPAASYRATPSNANLDPVTVLLTSSPKNKDLHKKNISSNNNNNKSKPVNQVKSTIVCRHIPLIRELVSLVRKARNAVSEFQFKCKSESAASKQQHLQQEQDFLAKNNADNNNNNNNNENNADNNNEDSNAAAVTTTTLVVTTRLPSRENSDLAKVNSLYMIAGKKPNDQDNIIINENLLNNNNALNTSSSSSLTNNGTTMHSPLEGGGGNNNYNHNNNNRQCIFGMLNPTLAFEVVKFWHLAELTLNVACPNLNPELLYARNHALSRRRRKSLNQQVQQMFLKNLKPLSGAAMMSVQTNSRETFGMPSLVTSHSATTFILPTDENKNCNNIESPDSKKRSVVALDHPTSPLSNPNTPLGRKKSAKFSANLATKQSRANSVAVGVGGGNNNLVSSNSNSSYTNNLKRGSNTSQMNETSLGNSRRPSTWADQRSDLATLTQRQQEQEEESEARRFVSREVALTLWSETEIQEFHLPPAIQNAEALMPILIDATSPSWNNNRNSSTSKILMNRDPWELIFIPFASLAS